MNCLYCSSPSKIVNSRRFRRGYEKWRRHKCDSCGSAFTTRELPDLEVSLRVVKRSGKTEPYYFNKLLVSIYKAIDHRTNAQVDAGSIAQTISTNLLPRQDASVSTEHISLLTIKTLKNYDPVGAVKYQAALTPQMNKRDVRRAIK